MSLAPATAAHAAALAAIHVAAFAPGERWDAAAMASLLTLPGVFGVLHPDGAMALARSVADETELLTIAVSPTVRRCGLGRAVLSAVLEKAGAGPVFLEVGAENAAARALYGAAGFEQCGRRRDYYGPGRDALLLRRDPIPAGSSPR